MLKPKTAYSYLKPSVTRSNRSSHHKIFYLLLPLSCMISLLDVSFTFLFLSTMASPANVANERKI